MAMKLEEAVDNRRRNRLAQKNLQEPDGNDDTKVFRDIFLNLELAFSEDIDSAKRFQCLKHARNLALELRNRHTTLDVHK